MAITRQQKEAQVADLQEKLKKASSVMFAHYIGLSVGNLTKLRSNLRKGQAEMKVAKKTLIKIAMKQAKAPEISDALLPGPMACIFSMGEPTSGPSIAYKFSKDHAQIKLIGGIFSGKLLSADEALSLATIPSRLELLAIFISICNGPLTQFMSACSSPLSGFARALSELAKQHATVAPVNVAADSPASAPSSPTATNS